VQHVSLDPVVVYERSPVHPGRHGTAVARECRALKLLDRWGQIKERRAQLERLRTEGPPPIVYDPTDGDELAAREAKERAQAQSDDDDPPGGIGR
jgi:hypothetical protein